MRKHTTKINGLPSNRVYSNLFLSVLLPCRQYPAKGRTKGTSYKTWCSSFLSLAPQRLLLEKWPFVETNRDLLDLLEWLPVSYSYILVVRHTNRWNEELSTILCIVKCVHSIVPFVITYRLRKWSHLIHFRPFLLNKKVNRFWIGKILR